MDNRKEYLGDGYQIWLEAGGYHHNNNRIALEPPVYQALLDYVSRNLRKHVIEPVSP